MESAEVLPRNAGSHMAGSTQVSPSKPLLHPSRDSPQVSINLSRRSSKDQGDDAFSRTTYVLEPTQDVDLAVREHDSRPCGVRDCPFGLSVFAGDTSNGPVEMFSGKGFYVGDLKRFDITKRVN